MALVLIFLISSLIIFSTSVNQLDNEINDSCQTSDFLSNNSILVLTYDLMLKNQNIDFKECKSCSNNKTRIINCTKEKTNLLGSDIYSGNDNLKNIRTLQSTLNCLGLCERHKQIRCDFINNTSMFINVERTTLNYVQMIYLIFFIIIRK